MSETHAVLRVQLDSVEPLSGVVDRDDAGASIPFDGWIAFMSAIKSLACRPRPQESA
ncbi:MAG: hypothetical protein ACRDXE_06725 [Acidimicrobiales bacterium]